jgi:hypothetical protein
MSGTGPRRHCGACDRDVLDLSAMTSGAAIDALIAREGKACVRYRTDAAGEIEFAPPPPLRPGPIAVAALALTACAGWVDEPAVVAPDELGMCVPDGDDPDMCDRPDVPPPADEGPTPAQAEPPPTPTDRSFTAQVELSPTVMGDTDGATPAELRKAEQPPCDQVTRVRHDQSEGIRMGMLVVYEEDPTKSLFDRKGTATSGPDWTRIAELMRMKRQLRREERQRRREARRG